MIDTKLRDLMIERLNRHRTDITNLYVYFQEHCPPLVDSKSNYNQAVHNISLAMYVACCQLDMAIMKLSEDG